MVAGVCFAANILFLALGFESTNSIVIICTIIGTTINSSAFYMAIVQITTAAYPTVMRAIAFGTLHLWSDVASILATVIISPLGRQWTVWPYLIPEIFIVVTWILAFFLQPETKGRKLPDSYEDAKRN